MGLNFSTEKSPVLPEGLKLAIEQPRTLRSVSNITRQIEFHDLILEHRKPPPRRKNKASKTETVDSEGFSLCQSPRARNRETVVCAAPGWACARYILDRAVAPIVVRGNLRASKLAYTTAHTVGLRVDRNRFAELADLSQR